MQQSLPQPIALEEVIADWPPQARKAAEAIAKVVNADNGEKAIAFMTSAADLAQGAATFVFQQITEAEKRIADIEDELLYEDGGLGDAMLALVFHHAQQAGVEGADDQGAYEEARDLLDQLANFNPEGQGAPPEEGMAPLEAAPPEAAPPAGPMGGGRPVMAGG